MGRMAFRPFVLASVLGSFGWIGAWTLLGRLLGEVSVVKNNLDKIMLGIVALVSVVAVVKLVQARNGATQLGSRQPSPRCAPLVPRRGTILL